VEKEWTTVEPGSEIKLVRVSGGTSGACFLMRNWGFGLVCELEYGISTFDSDTGFVPRELPWESVGHLWLEFRPNPFSGFGDQVSPHVHHERTTLNTSTVFGLWRVCSSGARGTAGGRPGGKCLRALTRDRTRHTHTTQN
jgi:hypothetical protein